MKKQYGFYFIPDRCIKCWACEIACKQWHGIKARSIRLRRVLEVTTGTFPEVKREFVSITCRHCGRAPCIAACPVKAISRRENGIIMVDRNLCIGCQVCLEACPFGVPQFDDEGIMHLCDMCADRLERGEKPVCAESCPTKALHWGTLEELSELAAKHAVKKAISAGDNRQ